MVAEHEEIRPEEPLRSCFEARLARLYERTVALNLRDGFRMRHERAPGDKLKDSDSSSDSSSSDSTSDDAEDLELKGLEAVLGGAAKRCSRAIVDHASHCDDIY